MYIIVDAAANAAATPALGAGMVFVMLPILPPKNGFFMGHALQSRRDGSAVGSGEAGVAVSCQLLQELFVLLRTRLGASKCVRPPSLDFCSACKLQHAWA